MFFPAKRRCGPLWLVLVQNRAVRYASIVKNCCVSPRTPGSVVLMVLVLACWCACGQSIRLRNLPNGSNAKSLAASVPVESTVVTGLQLVQFAQPPDVSIRQQLEAA